MLTKNIKFLIIISLFFSFISISHAGTCDDIKKTHEIAKTILKEVQLARETFKQSPVAACLNLGQFYLDYKPKKKMNKLSESFSDLVKNYRKKAGKPNCAVHSDERCPNGKGLEAWPTAERIYQKFYSSIGDNPCLYLGVKYDNGSITNEVTLKNKFDEKGEVSIREAAAIDLSLDTALLFSELGCQYKSID